MTRLNLSSAVCAAALVLLGGCSTDQSTEAGTAPPSASSVPASDPAAGPASAAAGPTASAAGGANAALCGKVAATKTALNEQLKKVVSADGTVPPAAGKKVMNDLATKLTGLAGSGRGEVPDALKALAAEASKAAKAANPMEAASAASFTAAGQKVDNACA